MRKPYVLQLDSIRKLISVFALFYFFYFITLFIFVIVTDHGRLFFYQLMISTYLFYQSTRNASSYEKIIAAAADFANGRVWPINFASESGPKFIWEKVNKIDHYFHHQFH